MPPRQEDEKSSLERARERLYRDEPLQTPPTQEAYEPDPSDVPHEWETSMPQKSSTQRGERHVRFAGIFFIIATTFFAASLTVAGYFFYFGSNTVSVDKVDIEVQGPLTIAGGDTVPLTILIKNGNPAELQNATIEISFPEGTRSADNVLAPYPRYSETIESIGSGQAISRSLRAVIFGGEGDVLEFPISVSYRMQGSNAVFVKKHSYILDITSSPLSVSVEAVPEVVSGKPFTTKFVVRSNATVPLENVVLAAELPFGFSFVSASLPFENNSFVIGTMRPGTTKEILLTGAIIGQDREERTIRATLGTSRSVSDRTPSIVYMTQSTTFSIVAPFLRTALSINGNTTSDVTLLPGAQQNVSVSYTNTLSTSVSNATVEVALSGSGIDYNSVRTNQGFYRSSDKTIIFSSGTDGSLGLLSPGASGMGSFSFATLPAGTTASPTVTFSVSVSGTRTGEANVPEQINSSITKTVKVQSSAAVDVSALRTSGPFPNTGVFPPQVDQQTTYTIALRTETKGSAVAGGILTTTLPEYVTYVNKTSGKGAISFNTTTRVVTWNVGDLVPGERAEGFFQISFTPSLSQKGTSPALTGPITFSGHDRFANVQVNATNVAATTATTRDPGYSPSWALVQ